LLHAELGLGLRRVLPDPSRRSHLDALRRLTRVPSVAADAAFTRRFWLLLGLIEQSRFDLLAAKTSFEAALLSSPGDSFALMALGRLEETELAQAMPGLSALTGGGGVQELDGGARAQLARAADLYRSALRVDPSLHEARLRLGRVLQLEARREEASRELSAVLERTGDRIHIYLANLLLGALHEAADEVPRAVACYRAAAAANPDGTTAKMALGHALHRLGHRQEALELVSVLLSAGSSGGEAGPDAWLLYKMGAFDLEDQVARLWRELRESVRR
jgi:tetratricopeptide (TPR) repeat protein